MSGTATRWRVNIYAPDDRQTPALTYAHPVPIAPLHSVITVPTAEGGEQRAVVAGILTRYAARTAITDVYTDHLIGARAGGPAAADGAGASAVTSGGAA